MFRSFSTKRMSIKTKPESVIVNALPLKCLVCGHTAFHRRKTHFDMALAKQLNPDWKDSTGYCLICAQCGHIHWFAEH